MCIGLLALMVIHRLFAIEFPRDRHARQVYLTGGVSLFLAMSLVYQAARYIPSGWISVIFGLSPLFTSLLASVLIGDSRPGISRIGGMLLGLLGLVVIFAESMNIETTAFYGVALVTMSAISHSTGAVLLQKLKPRMHAMAITTGSVGVALPFFLLTCAMTESWPGTIPSRTLYAILYLALMGTAMGFPMYYYLLKKLKAERVSIIALITPVSALLIGAAFNAEAISARVWLGTGFILSGLAIYEYGGLLQRRVRWLRWLQRPL
jgi:drug/metabolite transporter (DMT)-like permease